MAVIHPVGDCLLLAFEAGEASDLCIADAEFLGLFIPEVARCHENSVRFQAQNPEYSVVQGWIEATTGYFARHSVVEDAHGRLICVTLGPSGERVDRFLRHKAKWGKFDDLPNDLIAPSVVGC